MAENILHENEVKTNISAVKALMSIALAMAIFVLLDLLEIVDVGPDWVVVMTAVYTVLIAAICIFIKSRNFDRPYIKVIILAALMLYTGTLHFLYPLTTVFFLFGPILISIRYYDEKFTLKAALINWILYILITVANLIMEFTSPTVHALHLFQGMNIWQYPWSVFIYYGLVRTLLFAVTTIISRHILVSGREMVATQDEMYRKASELESELNAAARIQSSTMAEPAYTTANKKISIYAGIDPAKDVGGDFYDRFKVDENVMCLVMADVSDKGITAAMFSMRALTAIRYIIKDMALRGEMDLEQAVTRINQLLVHSNGEDMFVTVWIGCIDSRTGVGKYVNAGHVPPVIRHRDGGLDLIESEPQLMLGMFEGVQYRAEVFSMKDKDTLILYTDGITDARNDKDEVLDMEGFAGIINNADPAIYEDPEKVYTYLAKELDSYTEGNIQFDDETIMVINFDGAADTVKGTVNVAAGADDGNTDNGNTDDGNTAYEDTEIRFNDLSSATDMINAALAGKSCPEDIRRNIDVIIDEAGSNIMDYGFEGAYGEGFSQPQFMISYEAGDNYIVLTFIDSGMPFDPTKASEPEVTDEPQIGGMGIHLIKSLSDEMIYKYDDGRNYLIIKKIWGM